MQIPRALSTDRSVNRSSSPGDGVGPREPHVRARILASAERAFADKGYAAASLRTIAEAAGVTKPMIYYYFGSKEGLFDTVIAELRQAHEDDLRTAVASTEDPRSQLQALARVHLEWATSRALQWRLVLTPMLAPPEALPSDVREDCQPVDRVLLQEILRRAAEGGSLRNEDLEVTLFVTRGVVHACYESALLGCALPPHENLPERIVDLLWEGIGSKPGASRAKAQDRKSPED